MCNSIRIALAPLQSGTLSKVLQVNLIQIQQQVGDARASSLRSGNEKVCRLPAQGPSYAPQRTAPPFDVERVIERDVGDYIRSVHYENGGEASGEPLDRALARPWHPDPCNAVWAPQRPWPGAAGQYQMKDPNRAGSRQANSSMETRKRGRMRLSCEG